MAGGIIAKLPPSWRDFATSLKHKRQEFCVAELIGSLNVEERATSKNNRIKGVESSSANMVQKKNSFASRNKRRRTCKRTTMQSLSKLHSLRRKTTRNVVILYLLFFQLVFHLSGGWTVGLIFMCVLMFLC